MKTKKTNVTIIKDIDFSKVIFTDLMNVLLNMSAGLKPNDLTSKEIDVLERNFGPEWREKLGYSKSVR